MTRPEVQSGKRRVLLIDLGAQFGGVENYLVSLAELLAGEVELYGLCVLPELCTRLADRGVKIIRLPMFPGVLKPFRFLAALITVPLVLLRYRIHTVQLNGFLESVLILPARLLGRSAVYTRHGPFEIELYSWRGTAEVFGAQDRELERPLHNPCCMRFPSGGRERSASIARNAVFGHCELGLRARAVPALPSPIDRRTRTCAVCLPARALQGHSFADRSCAAPAPCGCDDRR